jgi:hypothetical protein
MPRNSTFAAVVAIVGLLLAPRASLAADPPSLKVSGGDHGLPETPMLIALAEKVEPGTFVVKGADGSVTLANVYEDAGRSILATVLEPVPAGESRQLPLQRLAAEGGRISGGLASVGVSVRASDQPLGPVAILQGDSPWTAYVANDGPKPYFYPLVGPSGARMSRSYPMEKVAGEKTDHPHQRSLWFTHGRVNRVDFWSETPGHGRIVETSRKVVSAGPAVAILRTTDAWLKPDGTKVLDDERTFGFYNTKTTRTFDVIVILKATAGAVTFGDTKEGMFGLRVPTSMDVTSKLGGTIVNSERLTDKAAWGKPASWVDYSGPVGGKTVGVAILDHPGSFRHPTTWHVRDYGLFAANPFGWKDFGLGKSGEFVLPAGESITFRYRVILHDGSATEARIADLDRVYAEVVNVSVD